MTSVVTGWKSYWHHVFHYSHRGFRWQLSRMLLRCFVAMQQQQQQRRKSSMIIIIMATLLLEWNDSFGWTLSSIIAALRNDGNLVVFDATAPPVHWSSETGLTYGIGGQGTRLYLPGDTSPCPCKAYMCIVVDLTLGGVDYYYAETNGAQLLLKPCRPVLNLTD